MTAADSDPAALVGKCRCTYQDHDQRAIEQLAKSPHRQGRRPILVLELVPARKSSGFGEGTILSGLSLWLVISTSQDLSAVRTGRLHSADDQGAWRARRLGL